MTCERCANTEKPLTLKQLAADLGLPYWKIQRAAKANQFPTYRFFNKRQMAFKSEVIALVMSRRGESQK
jgi:hypothetical protein